MNNRYASAIPAADGGATSVGYVYTTRMRSKNAKRRAQVGQLSNFTRNTGVLDHP